MTWAHGRPVHVAAPCVLVLALLATTRPALAHAVGVSSGEYRLDGKTVYGDLGMADRELARLLPAIDTNQDGAIDGAELAAGKGEVERAIVEAPRGLIIEADGHRCAGALDRAWVQEGDGSAVLQVHYVCPSPPGQLTLSMPMLEALTPGHRHMGRLFRGGKATVQVLDREHSTWVVNDAARTGVTRGTAWSMIELGVQHILGGVDHLVFLLGLLLVGGRLRSLVGVVTAFTIAHSITLALAALSVLAPSPRLVEPAIALSIAYVGVENLFVNDASKRWRITFPFGLVHGFGFAGALRESALARSQIPTALVGFNLGVEAGQLAVLSAALPFVLMARRAAWFRGRAVEVLSLAIAAGGAILFVARLARP